MANRKFRDLWDRSKDGNRREQRSFLRFAIVATAFFILFMFLKRDNIVTWVKAGFTLRQQERRIEALQQQNAGMEQTLDSYISDRDSLETLAREEFGFAAEGDDVYILDSSR